MKRTIISGLTIIGLACAIFTSPVHAAGSAVFSLSPASGSKVQGSSFTVQISENEAANAVTAKLAYDPSMLTCNSVSNSFGTTVSATCGGGNITISGFAAGGTTASGSVGSINFTVLGNSGTTSVSFVSGSQIANNGSNLWNGVAYGAAYSLSAPVSTPTVGGRGSDTTTPTTTGSSSASTTTSGQKSTTSNPSTSTNSATAASSDATAATSQSTAEPKASNKNKALVKSVAFTSANDNKSASQNGFVWAGIVLLIAAAGAGYYFLSRDKTATKKVAATGAAKNKIISSKKKPTSSTPSKK